MTDTKNEITKATVQNAIVATNEGEYSMFLDKVEFEQAWRAAVMFSKSDLVPTAFKNKPENCMIVFNMAKSLKADPIMIMQKTYIIQGKPAMEGQLIIALVNSKGPFADPIQWEFEGEGRDRQCTAYATLKSTKKVCRATVTWKMVELEGWNKKSGSKWLTMPDLMFQYRSATFLARLYCPEVILGFQTVDEVIDVSGANGVATDEDNGVETRNAVKVSPLEEKLSKPVEAFWSDTGEPKGDTVESEKPKVRKKKEKPQPEPEPEPEPETPKVAPEERYYCPTCEHIDSDAGKTSDGRLKCLKCLDTNVIDRQG